MSKLGVSLKILLSRVSSYQLSFRMATVHQSAKNGFQEGSHYDKNRPSYTDELVNHAISSLHKSKQDVKYNILELGAGTGLFTRKILSLLPKEVKYMATDPSENFLAVLKEKSPNVDTSVCSAGAIPLPDSSVENILCAQCFHWFATADNLTEMVRVLAPGGRVLMAWNNKATNQEAWLGKMEDVLTLYYGDTPRKITGKWKEVIQAFPLLREVEHRFMQGNPDVKGTKQNIVDHFTSISVIAQLGDAEKAGACERLQAVLDERFPDDDVIIPVKLNSELYCAEKI